MAGIRERHLETLAARLPLALTAPFCAASRLKRCNARSHPPTRRDAAACNHLPLLRAEGPSQTRVDKLRASILAHAPRLQAISVSHMVF
jgi:hypothetical protein